MAEVRMANVTKIFPGDVVAVKDINIDVKDKEFLVLVGPSGCGKSTTLRMVAGLEEVTEGEIYIGDRLVNDVPPKDRDIAMVFQNYALYPHMTVYKNMAFGLKLRKFRKDEIDRRVREAAEILGITDLLDRRPKALSGGQRQRVAVGRAIVRKPKVFLFDEPLSNLDAKLRVQMRAELIKLHSKLQTTVIYVTHDQVEAMTMGSRIAVMKDGIIQQIDSPLSLYNKPVNKFVAGFIGSPPMNFMEGIIEVKDEDVFFNEGNIKVKVPQEFAAALRPYNNQTVTFGIRPEDIYIAGYGEPETGTAKVKSKVEIIEPMGAEIYVYLTTGKTPFVARIDAHVPVALDEMKTLAFDMKKTHFFDNTTEKTIV
ncbi:sn-glycerol-3-phosphate ABC transporter ATP-binding protein UgpC [Candidatus Sumerlaeota bacterium]|nr:sn-glycerol-3-phosphate ABC transporter ATP-binding protein UgpC [Candidatus Sumerlaeota bacterium]